MLWQSLGKAFSVMHCTHVVPAEWHWLENWIGMHECRVGGNESVMITQLDDIAQE